jgi:hypothetical protein
VPPSLWRKSAAVTSLSLSQLLDDGARSAVTKVIVSFLSFAAAVLDASRGGGFYSGRPDPARSIGRGWTISEILFCARMVFLGWLDKLSVAPAPKWHNSRGRQ